MAKSRRIRNNKNLKRTSGGARRTRRQRGGEAVKWEERALPDWDNLNADAFHTDNRPNEGELTTARSEVKTQAGKAKNAEGENPLSEEAGWAAAGTKEERVRLFNRMSGPEKKYSVGEDGLFKKLAAAGMEEKTPVVVFHLNVEAGDEATRTTVADVVKSKMIDMYEKKITVTIIEHKS